MDPISAYQYMERISHLEKEAINLGSVLGAVAIFGCAIPFTIAPVKAIIQTISDKMHGDEGRIRDLYKNNLYRAFA